MFEQLDVLRRIAERGKALAEWKMSEADEFLDLFVHLLDEIAKTKNYYETYEEIE